MWRLGTWATASHERAIANAREGSTECSWRRVEREEVALFLAERAAATAPAGSDAAHTASTEAVHHA